MLNFKIIFLLLFYSNLFCNVVNINELTSSFELLQNSEIYIDKSRDLTINKIENQDIKFEKNEKNILSFGYSPSFDVWIKFTLKNDSNKVVKKIIEYNNPLTTNLTFYDLKDEFNIQEDGLLSKNSKKLSINPIFIIELSPYEQNTYYLKASSYITTLIVDLELWSEDDFYKKEIKHQIILSLFFGAMFILGIYNLFIFLFTKDISYLYYVIYILGLILHHLMYTDLATLNRT